jgi:hypothetical protein|tara:strand:- start:46 stop:579 length:534 start_codon:yes stop_codon:yes gene_type:complete
MASIIKANQLQDFGGNSILTSDGAGVVTPNASGIKNTPAFRATLSNATSMSNGAIVKLEFGTEVYDTDSAYDTSNYRFTVPSGEAGKYFFKAQYALALSDQQYATVRFYKNGSNVEFTQNLTSTSSSGSLTVYMANCTVMNLSAGDYVEIYGRQDSGGTLTANTSRSEFLGYKLIGA